MAYETIGDLIKAFREDEKDCVGPEYFWSDAQLVRFANGALVAFAEQTLSIIDDSLDIPFRAGDSSLPYPQYIIDVLDAQLVIGERDWSLEVRAPADMPRSRMPRTGRPALLVVNSSTGSMRLAATPQEPGLVRLTVIRRPIKDMQKDSRLTDVNPAHRETLLHYIKHRAYSVKDAEIFDAVKAGQYLAEFNFDCQRIYEYELRRRSAARSIRPARW